MRPRSFRPTGTTTRPMEVSYEQHSSQCASRLAASGRNASVRSADAVAGLSRTTAGSLACPAGRLESPAPCVEERRAGRLCAARSLGDWTADPGGNRRHRPAHLLRPHRFRAVLGLVWALVAAAAD